jgi:hypothetical protein
MNWPDEFVVFPQGPVLGGLQVVAKPVIPSGFGEGVPNSSQISRPAAWIGFPFWSLTWYVNDLVTPHPVAGFPPTVVVQEASAVVESVPETIERLVGTWTVPVAGDVKAVQLSGAS